jgi:hypothetical protein
MTGRWSSTLLLALLVSACSAPATLHSPFQQCGGKEPHDCIVREVERQQESRTVIQVDFGDTIGWGCPCPPLVVLQSGDSVEHGDEFAYPLLAQGARAMPDLVGKATYRMTGHYTGAHLDYYDWMKARGRKAPARGFGDRARHWAKAHPVFEVHQWCILTFDALSEVPDDEAEEMTEETGAEEYMCKERE